MKGKTKELITSLVERYPEAEPKDLFKFLFQSAFGCEHLVESEQSARNYIEIEYLRGEENALPLLDELDGDYVRLNLRVLDMGLTTATLTKLFTLSARTEEEGRARLIAKLNTVEEMLDAGQLPFERAAYQAALREWQDRGYPPVRHSESFHRAYHPSYRVISASFAQYISLLIELDRRLQKGPLTLAVEGGSASGKTTLSSLLEKIYGARSVHMDDFFLRPEQRTPERLAEIGGNVDRERFIAEALPGLLSRGTVTYRPFDCSLRALSDPIVLEPRPLTVVEGVYSTHPEIEKYYDLSVLLDIPEDLQKQRVEKRNPDLSHRFLSEWIPMENAYFSATDIHSRTDLILKIK